MRVAAIIVLGALFVSPAAAAGWMSCADSGGLASFDYFVAEGDTFNVTAVTVTASEQVWASDPANGPGEPVLVGPFHDDDASTSVGAINELLIPIADLQLRKATEGELTVHGGTLWLPGVGVWAVTCVPTS
ncbi:MAG: hypothetical protein EOP22_12365 [Hyphomicrobiales bacterium]|nr:MAG: hypothetical protein EOP22_12365 [Hyphomicrobiales bacterium]